VGDARDHQAPLRVDAVASALGAAGEPHPAAAQVVALEAREPDPLELPVAGLDRHEDVGQKRRPVDRLPAEQSQRRRSDPGVRRQVVRAVVRIHADPDHDLAVSHLGQDAGELSALDHDVVRPPHRRLGPGRLGHRAGDDERERRQPLGRRPRVKREREEQARAARARPRPAAAATAGRLLLAGRHAALGHAAGQLLRRRARLVPDVGVAEGAAKKRDDSVRTQRPLSHGTRWLIPIHVKFRAARTEQRKDTGRVNIVGY